MKKIPFIIFFFFLASFAYATLEKYDSCWESAPGAANHNQIHHSAAVYTNSFDLLPAFTHRFRIEVVEVELYINGTISGQVWLELWNDSGSGTNNNFLANSTNTLDTSKIHTTRANQTYNFTFNYTPPIGTNVSILVDTNTALSDANYLTQATENGACDNIHYGQSQAERSSGGWNNGNPALDKWWLVFGTNVSTAFVTDVSISPTSPIIQDDLLGYCTVDANEGDLNIEWQWHNNSVNYTSGTVLDVAANTSINVANLSKAITKANEEWTLSCRGFSGRNFTYYQNSTPVNISNFNIDNCTTYTTRGLNISFRDTDNKSIDVTFEHFLDVTLPLGQQFNASIKGTGQNYSICFEPSGATIYSDMTITYVNDTTTFEYSTVNTTITSATQELILYLDTGTSQVIFTVLDQNGAAVAGAVIKVLKFNVGDGTYTTTEILRTDGNGQTIGNIVLIDAFYRFIIEVDGVVRLIEPDNGGVRVLSASKTFSIDLGDDNWFDFYDEQADVTSMLTFNNVTNVFTYTWTDPNSDIRQGCLRVEKRNVTSRTLVNDTCTVTAAGTINQGVTALTPGNSYYAVGYIQGSPPIVTDSLLITLAEAFGFDAVDKDNDLLFYSFLAIVALALVGMPSPTIALILAFIGVTGTVILGMYKIGLGLAVAYLIAMAIQIFRSRE